MARSETWATERVEQVIADLEQLKSKVAQIETRYSVLSHDYTQICEEALNMMNKLKPQEVSVAQTANHITSPAHRSGNHHTIKKPSRTVSVPHGKRNYLPTEKAAEERIKMPKSAEVESKLKISRGKSHKTEDLNTDMHTAAFVSVNRIQTVPAIEADENMELAAKEAAPVAELLEIGYSSPLSLEDLIQFQQVSNGTVPKSRITPQSVIDLLGRGIEFALDKLGDGLTLPFVLIVKLVRKLAGSSRGKK